MSQVWRYSGVFAGMLALLAAPAFGAKKGADAPSNERQLLDSLESYSSTADSIKALQEFLDEDLKGGPLTRSTSLVEIRFDEGVYAYLVENYDRAALLMFSLLDNNEIKDENEIAQAQWYLADSLFLLGNYAPAKAFFLDIVNGEVSHPFYSDSVARLLEIFGTTGDDDEFNIYYKRFLRSAIGSAGSPVVRYSLGKTLYRRGDYGKAIEVLADFPEGSGKTRMGRYLEATSYAARARLAQVDGKDEAASADYLKAIEVYRGILDLPISEPAHEEVQALAWLAIGRVHLELGNTSEAVNAYQRIDWSSPHFADALYETTWAFILQDNFDEALRTIDIFELAYPLDTRQPELELLKAHLQVKKENWDTAVAAYGTVGKHYESVRDRLDSILHKSADPIIFFNQLVDTGTSLIEEDLMVPILALRIAREDHRVDESVRLARELQEQRTEINAARDIVGELEAALYADAEGRLLQTYRMGHLNVQRLRAQADQLLASLAGAEADFLFLSSGGDSAVRELLELRKSLGTSARRIAAADTKKETLSRDIQMQGAAIAERAHGLILGIDEQSKKVDAMERFLADARRRNLHDSNQEAQLVREIQLVRGELSTLRDEVAGVEARMAPSRVERLIAGEDPKSGFGGGSLEVVSAARELHRKVLSLRGKARSSNASSFFAQVDAIWGAADPFDSWAEQAHARLDELEVQELEEIRSSVTAEKQALAQQDSDAFRYDQETRALNGTIAESSFLKVQQKFADLVLRADMGVADVYWIQRNKAKAELRAIAMDRGQAMMGLQARFADVLSGFDDLAAEADAAAENPGPANGGGAQ